MQEISIQFYGVLAEVTGTRQTTLCDVCSVEEIKKHLQSTYPGIDKHNYIVAINNIIVMNNQTVPSGSTIAVMPPFSGG